MAGGQALDIAYGRKKKSKLIMDRINYLKTARLFEASAKLGAIAAGASLRKIATMAQYGVMLGMEFQIVDDCLDGDGYVKLVGHDGARRVSRSYTEKAKRALRIFGKKAEVLMNLADSLSERIV